MISSLIHRPVKTHLGSIPSNTYFRYRKTLLMLNTYFDAEGPMLNLGGDTVINDLFRRHGFKFDSPDLGDLDYVKDVPGYACTTCFEVLEHLCNPFNLLTLLRGKLILTVPLRQFHKRNYWNNDNDYEQHYIEFEPRALRKLLSKTGWTIIHEEFWRRPINVFWPKWMAVIAFKHGAR